MANMSYCRFQNTLQDLRDCAEHILDDDLSREETRARIALVDTCAEILETLGVDFSGSVASKELDTARRELLDGEED